MTGRKAIIASLAAAAMLAVGALPAAAGDGTDLRAVSPKVSGYKQIENTLSQDRVARVIVSVKTAPGLAALGDELSNSATRTQAKAEIKAAVDSVFLRHFGVAQNVNGAPVVRLGTAPSFSLALTREQILDLVRDDAVVSVRPDLQAKPQLDVTTYTIGMPGARSAGATGYGRTAVVIDTGVQTNHPFIGTSRVVAEGCFLTTNSCPNGTNEQTGTGSGGPDNNGIPHGTHVAGIVLGKNPVSGGSPKYGVSYRSKLVAINVFESTGYTYSSSMIRALEYVEELAKAHSTWRIRSVNMSIGGGDYADYCDSLDADFKAVVDRLRALRVSVVIAAGNDSLSNMMSWPGCMSNVVSVAATDRQGDKIAYYSNINNLTRLFAPGGDYYNGGEVVSSVLNGQYGEMQGTSMATPHVTGAIAAIATKYSSAQVSVIEDALRRTGVSVTDTRIANGVTLPRIAVNKAMSFLAAPSKPSNDNFASAKTLAYNGQAWGSTSGATRETGEPTHVGSTAGSVWWKVKLASTASIKVATLGSNFDTVMAVYTGSSVSGLTLVKSNDNVSSTEKSSSVSFTASSSKTYYIAVAPKKTGYEGTVHIAMSAKPSNDNFASARTVSVSTRSMTFRTGTNVNATTQTGEPSYHGINSVWWKFTAPASGTYTIDTYGSMNTAGGLLDTMLAVYTGTSLSGLTVVTYNDEAPSGYSSIVTFSATKGTTYYVAVGAWPSATYPQGNIRLSFTPPNFVYQGEKQASVQ